MGYDLLEDLRAKQYELDRAIAELRPRGNNKAAAENAYKVALATKMLELRDAGYPATMIGDLARGDKTIARLRQERDIADTLYQSCIEAINAKKLNLRLIDAQIDREWHNAK